MFTVLAFNIKIFDTFSICVSPPLSMKEAAKIMHICSVVIYPLEKKIHWNKQHFGTRYKSFVAYRPPFTHCICEVVTGTPGGGGTLRYFLGGYVPPGTPNWHPVLKKIPLKLIPRSRNGPIFYKDISLLV